MPVNEVERMRIGAIEAAAEIERLQMILDRIIRHYDARSELYTSDADLAAGMAAIARETYAIQS